MGKAQENWLVKQYTGVFNFTHFALQSGQKMTSRNTKSYGRGHCVNREGGAVPVAEAQHPMAEGALYRSRGLVR